MPGMAAMPGMATITEATIVSPEVAALAPSAVPCRW